MRKFISVILLSGMLTTVTVLMPDTITGIDANAADVTGYSYKITPLLAPFNEYFFVETDNPDPRSFRFADKASVYSEDSAIEFDWDDWNEKIRLYADIKYDDPAVARVNGGYIFRSFSTDGGELVLQSRVPGRYSWDDTWEDTSIKLNLQKLQDDADYLIDTYATKSDFFENMDAVQKGFDSICLYSGSYIRGNVVKTSDYWEVVTAGHSDQSFYIYSPYSRKDTVSLFASVIYPFRYDSLGFPSVMGKISKRLDSSSSYKWNSDYHWLIDVTYNDETKSYGGAGDIKGQGITEDKIKKYYTFGKNGTKIDLKETFDLQKEYSQLEMDDDIPREGAVTWKNLCEKVGSGSWCRINGSMNSYAYFYRRSEKDSYSESEWGVGNNLYYGGDLGFAQDSWTDGRYVSSGKLFVKGEKFEDHPTSSIILKDVVIPQIKCDVKYKYNYDEQRYESIYSVSQITEKVKTAKFVYNSEKDAWIADSYYAIESGCANYDRVSKLVADGLLDQKYADMLILTQDEVKALRVDRNTNNVPDDGYIYDGKSEPGTPFHYTAPENNSIVSSNAIELGESVNLSAVGKGGTGELGYAFLYRLSGDKNWKTIGEKFGSENTAQFKPSAAGTYDILISIKDTIGKVTSKRFELTVNAPKVLKSTSNVQAGDSLCGTKMILAGSAEGGIAPYYYTYQYQKPGKNSWITLGEKYSTADSANFTPKTAGTYKARVIVKDSKGEMSSSTFTVKVTGTLVENKSTISAVTVNVNNAVTINAKSSGGTAPYYYTYEYRKSGDTKWTTIGKRNSSLTVASYAPSSKGDFEVRSLIKDKSGYVAAKTFKIKVK